MKEPIQKVLLQRNIATNRSFFETAVDELERTYGSLAIAKGWTPQETQDFTSMMQNEFGMLGYILDQGNPPSTVCNMGQAEEKMAKIILKILEFAFGRDMEMGNAIVEKLNYDLTLPQRWEPK